MSASPVPAFSSLSHFLTPTSASWEYLQTNHMHPVLISAFAYWEFTPRHIHWKEWRELSRCENCFLPLMFSVFESVIVCVKHADRETPLSKQKLVLLVASYVFLLNSSFLLLLRHTRTPAWPCTHHTVSPLLLFLNTFLC